MAITVGNDSDTSRIGNLPVGLFYYYIGKEMIDSMSILGYVGVIESVTFNPFIDTNDLDLIESNFNTDKFGTVNGTIPKCYRITQNNKIQKLLYEERVFPYRIEFDNDYEPKQYCYPFRYFIVTDYINPPLLIKPQLVNNEKIRLHVYTAPLSQSSKYNIFVQNYKGDLNGNLEGVINTTAFMLPITSSVYSNFLATSANAFNTNMENALFENDMTLRHGLKQNEFNKWSGLFGSVMGLGGGLATKNPFSIVGSIGSGVSSVLGANMNEQQMSEKSAFNEHAISSSANAQISDMLSTPRSLKTCGNDTLFNLVNSRQAIDIIEYRPTYAYQQRIKKYFERYGYALNRYERINVTSRKYFNFIKTHIANVSGDKVPNIHIAEIKDILNKGITFWHVDNGVDIGNYNVVNREVKF